MPEAEQTPFLIRINNLMEALNDWLNAYDAESDEDEDEEALMYLAP